MQELICRLVEAEKALDGNRLTSYADYILTFQTHDFQNHLNKCAEASKVNEWTVKIKETQSLILGADSVLQLEAVAITVALQDKHICIYLEVVALKLLVEEMVNIEAPELDHKEKFWAQKEIMKLEG